ncbi:MAG: DUF3160 domain-containing protein [Chloroflexota bacterium]
MEPRRLAFVASLLALAFAATPVAPALAATPAAPAPAASPAASPAVTPAPSPIDLPSGATAGFGDYQLVPLLDGSTPYAGPKTPTSLTGVLVRGEPELLLKDPDIRRTLLRKGFVIVPADSPRFSMTYEDMAYTGTPVYATTDAAYDTWHLVFDKLLRNLETTALLPRLKTLVTGMLANAKAQAAKLAGTDLADEAAKVVGMLQVAATPLGIKTGPLSPEASAELALVRSHSGLAKSPLLGTDIDYSLYTPRGHYTRSKDLTRYFVAMSVLGQTAFALPGALQSDGTRADDSGLRIGALAARTLVGHPELEKPWKAIYEPTAFLVGLSDDYSPFELVTAVESAAPGAMDDPTPLADDATIEAIAAQLAATRPVKIDTERPSVRLMGTRFVLDSWIMDQLLAPNVGTRDDPRLLPSPLDVASAFGSRFAYALQKQAGQTAYADYNTQMKLVRDAVAARPDEAWGSTVYDAWLAAIEPMWLPHGAAFPDYLRTPAWQAKDHQTGFGSYAELKHDTILYTKQAVGEMGDAGEPPPMPRNWVEPDPVPFARLAAMAELTRGGLKSRGLLNARTSQLLLDYQLFAERLSRIATDELAGTPISTEDNNWLGDLGGILEDFWWRTGDTPDQTPAPDEMSAIVADIASGRDHTTGEIQVVETGTGAVDTILVLVPDDKGRFQVARGGVYSYYEFLQPVSERLTDEAWRAMLENGEAPPRPSWMAPILREFDQGQ